MGTLSKTVGFSLYPSNWVAAEKKVDCQEKEKGNENIMIYLMCVSSDVQVSAAASL